MQNKNIIFYTIIILHISLIGKGLNLNKLIYIRKIYIFFINLKIVDKKIHNDIKQ